MSLRFAARTGIGHDQAVTGEVLDDAGPTLSPMLSVCPVPGCSSLTMGGTCVAHDLVGVGPAELPAPSTDLQTANRAHRRIEDVSLLVPKSEH